MKITGLPPRPLRTLKRPEAFLDTFLRGVELVARTRVVDRVMNPRTRQWEKTQKEVWYSLIDGFEGISAGLPFVLRGRRE